MNVILLSGGLDSSVCAAITPDLEVGLFVDYGQPHAANEGSAAIKMADRFNLDLEAVTTKLPMRYNRGDSTMLVPGRNLLLLGLAAQVARGKGFIVFGANADDYADYPDCRPAFISAASAAIGMEIRTPLLDRTKADIGALAREHNVPVASTWSCYYPENGQPCGKCMACQGRARAVEAGVVA